MLLAKTGIRSFTLKQHFQNYTHTETEYTKTYEKNKFSSTLFESLMHLIMSH